MSAVVAIERGERVALLLAAAHPEDPSLEYVSICRTDRGPTTEAMDSVIAIADAEPAGPVSIDATATFTAPVPEGEPAPSEGLIAGRFSEPVTTVVIELADGTSLEPVLADGRWLAWWPGRLADARAVRGLDGAGRTVLELPVPGE